MVNSIVVPPEWFTLTEVADSYTHTFAANKKSRSHTLFPSSTTRFFMLREGILIYYVEQGKPKGCVDIVECKVSIDKPGSKDESVRISPSIQGEVDLELSKLVITKEFVNWQMNRSEKDKPREDTFKSIASAEVAGAVRFHANIAFLKRQLASYFRTVLNNQEQAVVAGSVVWHRLQKQMQDLLTFINKPENLMSPLTQHAAWNGGGAHPLVQLLWQSYAQLLYLQIEADRRPENPYVGEMVDMYNKYIQSCLARTHVLAVGESDYDRNDPTMGIVRLNQVLAMQGRFDEYVPNTKILIDFSLNKSGPNLLASTQCLLLASALRDVLGEVKQAKLWAEKALEIFDNAPNKDYHPLVFPGTEAERRASLQSEVAKYK